MTGALGAIRTEARAAGSTALAQLKFEEARRVCSNGAQVGDSVFAFGRFVTVTRQMLCIHNLYQCRAKARAYFARHTAAGVPVVLDTPPSLWWHCRGWRMRVGKIDRTPMPWWNNGASHRPV